MCQLSAVLHQCGLCLQYRILAGEGVRVWVCVWNPLGWAWRFHTPWSMCMVNWWPFKYSLQSRTVHTIGMHSRRVVLCRYSATVKERHHYPIGWEISSGYFCGKMQLILIFQASMSSAMFLPVQNSTKTGADINAFLNVSMAWSLSLLGGAKAASCLFLYSLIKRSRDLHKAGNISSE